VLTVAQARSEAAQRRPGGQRRLTSEQQAELLAEYDAKTMSATALARKHGVSRATLYRLVSQPSG
jgi:transposase-like protein